MSPGEQKFRSSARTPDMENEMKKRKKEEKDSDGEKSDQELVVDVANDDSVGPANGNGKFPLLLNTQFAPANSRGLLPQGHLLHPFYS